MRRESFNPWLIILMILTLPMLTVSQTASQRQTLIVNNQPGEAIVVQLAGRSYVELEALARLANGTVGYRGNLITLTLPASSTNTPPTNASSSQQTLPGFSREFLRAAIEQMATIREWRTALTNAVQNGYPVGERLIAPFRGQAAQDLRLAAVAVSTDSDRKALQLLTNEFNNMNKLTDRFLEASKSMQYVSPDALQNDSADQKILTCAHSLASMAASNQFVDDGSCQ
jgi:hypothetical protein